MAKQAIGIGSLPNDGGGDSLRDGAIKLNSNFSEIYTALGDGNTITNSIAFASVAGVSTLSDYATNAGIATFSTTAGLLTYISERVHEVPSEIMANVEPGNVWQRVGHWMREHW